MSEQRPSVFERETLYRLIVETARLWLVGHFLRSLTLPSAATFYVYPGGPDASLDWGNAPGPDDPFNKPMRGKRVRVTFEIENH